MIRCGWHIVLDWQASIDCKPPTKANHHGRRRANNEQVYAIKLSKIRRTSSALVCLNSTFVDTMKALDAYGGSLDLEYRARFFDALTKDIIDDILWSKYLRTRTRATFVKYIIGLWDSGTTEPDPSHEITRLSPLLHREMK